MRPLSATLAKIAREQLNEQPDRVEQDLNILRVWIGQQSHLRARTLDEFLIAFLRRCRYSLEETKKRIENFFSYYNLFPEALSNRYVTKRLLDINKMGFVNLVMKHRNFKDIFNPLDSVHYYPEIPKCDNETAILIVRFGAYDAKKYHLREILHYVTMAMEIIALENDNATVAGVCQVLDLSQVGVEVIRQFDDALFKKWYDWMQKCCPLLLREVYIINSCKEVHRIMQLMRNLLPCVTTYPVIVLKTTAELYKYIPRKCLPEEYGGCNGHIAESVAYMEDMLKSYRDYFDEDANYGTCEELRNGEIVPYEAEFGSSGSFRKLQVE